MEEQEIKNVDVVEATLTKKDEDKPYELRPLETRDLFKFVKVLKHLDIAQIVEQVKAGGMTESQVGMVLAVMIVNNIDKCEQPLYEFVSQISNLTAEDVAKMPPKWFMVLVKDVVSQAGFSDFLSLAGQFGQLA